MFVGADAADGAGRAVDEEGLAVRLADLALTLAAEEEPAEVLRQVVDAAAREIPGTAHAGCASVLGAGRPADPACTDTLGGRLDALQYALGEGPCLDAVALGAAVRANDLGSEDRWPGFTAAAVRQGVGSALSFPLLVPAGPVGALTVYADRAGAFPNDAVRAGEMLAAHAAIAVSHAREKAQLRLALDSRDTIGQALGMLRERYGISARRAFRVLVARSQDTNIKLRDVAAHLVETGELPQRGPHH
ncbi:GAF and ANTAR domain-containing protein [Streptomyces sp. B6B3]|uniref:GAF and ANTAR domain-containing protein n=1 Tax=Streptomyces sp. B6B3 TaxID=3153570 RepID=UPI00325CEEE5